MTPKKPRKSLDDSLASEFVYGNPEPTSQNEETMHRKLSILAARTGKKKAEIVRMLLDEALQELNE